MKLGVMQPYLFPYLGYFQLMDCVDTYAFCGDFQYIKGGWVNRNRLRMDDTAKYFTFSVAKDDYRKNIDQRYYSNLKEDCDKLKRNIFQHYKMAVNFDEAYSVLEKAMSFCDDNVAYFNMHANYVIAQYLGIDTNFTCTDKITDATFRRAFKQAEREERGVLICRYFNAQTYINAIGGTSLYRKDFFAQNNIELRFLRMDNITYSQYRPGFIPGLSIIDVLMWNKVNDIKLLLKRYQLE